MVNLGETLSVLLVFDKRNRLLVRINAEGSAEPTYVAESTSAAEMTPDCVEKVTGVASKTHLLTQQTRADQSLAIYC